MNFMQKVRLMRGRLGLSQSDLAKKSGLSLRTLTYYESGERLPHAAQLSRLADALGVSEAYLIDDGIDDPLPIQRLRDYADRLSAGADEPDNRNPQSSLEDAGAVFKSAALSRDEKDAYFLAVMKAYLDFRESD